jgi:uncharacterized repeat protein (TIGR01451 family)
MLIVLVLFLSSSHCLLQAVSAQSAPSLSIRKSVNDAKVLVGEDVLFTIQIKNDQGLDATIAENVIVTDTLPVGLKPYTDRWSVTPSVGEKGEQNIPYNRFAAFL